MNQGFVLPKEGWTYCPVCDAENMLTTEPGKRYDCPMCGLILQATSMQGFTLALAADPPLDFEAIMRYQFYLAKEAVKRHEAEQAELLNVKMPLRVWLCLKTINAVAWWFRCECRVIRDKKFKQKEGKQ